MVPAPEDQAVSVHYPLIHQFLARLRDPPEFVLNRNHLATLRQYQPARESLLPWSLLPTLSVTLSTAYVTSPLQETSVKRQHKHKYSKSPYYTQPFGSPQVRRVTQQE